MIARLNLFDTFKKADVLPMCTKVPKEHRMATLSRLVNLRKLFFHIGGSMYVMLHDTQIFVADLTSLKFFRCATNSIFRWGRLGWGRVGRKSAGLA
jgi:hypothetical protein